MSDEVIVALISGVGGVVLGGLLTFAGTYYSAKRAGLQKIAEARMEWNAQHRKLSLGLYQHFQELELAGSDHERLRAEIVAAAVEVLLLINPDGNGDPALDEGRMEVDLLSRLAMHGISIDMELVRRHRAVLKHAWRTAKSEFWRATWT